jgi:hypoxanthine phosphoribosyltransferase
MREMHPDIARVIISEDEIQARVAQIAAQLEEDYAHADEIYMVGILKGAFIFLADLARCLHKRHVVDFMAVSSYGMTATTTGAVRILMDLREPIQNRHVLIVEDILDSGNTLAYLYHTLQERRPASLKTCVLCKKQREHADVPIDYLGFEIPDVWVVGYGLDFAETHRTLPYIGELKPEIYQNVE